jgi:hypothetical protein
MSCARALATIESVSPPLDLLTYQIHMPFSSNAVCGSSPAARSVPTRTLAKFEREPPRST